MANIMITEQCNLHCEYCFANEFVNGNKKNEIAINDFKNILDFILGDGSEIQIGLIGGEPTLHSKQVTLYTNGILLKDYADKLSNQKFHFLINCNDIKSKKMLFGQFMESLDMVFERVPERVALGSNFYKPDYDYQYILELLKRYPCKRLRVSIAVRSQRYTIMSHWHILVKSNYIYLNILDD